VDDDSEPVWSPDFKSTFAHKVRDPDNGTFDIYMLDLVTTSRKEVQKRRACYA